MRNPYDSIETSTGKEALVYRVIPNMVIDILQKYFRLEIEGLENIPKTGGALIAPNHSGFMGFDAMILLHEVIKHTGRVPRVMTHYFWFLSSFTSKKAHKMGYIKASTNNGTKTLNNNHMIILFPEGEAGNFKPTKNAYKLQEFKRGFVRMAIKTGSPIVPTLIIGAEESNITIAQMNLGDLFKQFKIPIPLNLFPLPAKWKIIFLPPIKIPHAPDKVDDSQLVRQIAKQIQSDMQEKLNEELKKRPGIFIKRPPWLKRVLKDFWR